MLWRWSITAVVLVSLSVCGCGKDKSNETSNNDYVPEESSDNGETSVVSPSNGEDRSPANGNSVALPTDAQPREVVEAYIQALNETNTSVAEALLTEVAKIETRRAQLVVQPAWSTDANYQVTDVSYATSRSVRAEVATEWVERDASGATADFTIVWMLYKQNHNGWRISGMKTHFTPNGNLVYLNFEDPEDMLVVWERGMNEAEEANSRQSAGNTSDTQNR